MKIKNTITKILASAITCAIILQSTPVFSVVASEMNATISIDGKITSLTVEPYENKMGIMVNAADMCDAFSMEYSTDSDALAFYIDDPVNGKVVFMHNATQFFSGDKIYDCRPYFYFENGVPMVEVGFFCDLYRASYEYDSESATLSVDRNSCRISEANAHYNGKSIPLCVYPTDDEFGTSTGLSDLCKLIGAKVSYDNINKTATITKDTKTIVLVEESDSFVIGNKKYGCEKCYRKLGGAYVIEIGFFCSLFGLVYEYDELTCTLDMYDDMTSTLRKDAFGSVSGRITLADGVSDDSLEVVLYLNEKEAMLLSDEYGCGFGTVTTKEKHKIGTVSVTKATGYADYTYEISDIYEKSPDSSHIIIDSFYTLSYEIEKYGESKVLDAFGFDKNSVCNFEIGNNTPKLLSGNIEYNEGFIDKSLEVTLLLGKTNAYSALYGGGTKITNKLGSVLLTKDKTNADFSFLCPPTDTEGLFLEFSQNREGGLVGSSFGYINNNGDIEYIDTLDKNSYYSDAAKLKVTKEPIKLFVGNTKTEFLSWSVDSTGTLNISGVGALPDLISSEAQPWYSKRHLIKKLNTSEGITSIGAYSFAYCDKLCEISLPDSLVYIGEGAFIGCPVTNIPLTKNITKFGKNIVSNGITGGCYDSESITFEVGSTTVSVGESEHDTSIPCITDGNSIFVPARSLALALGTEFVINQSGIAEFELYGKHIKIIPDAIYFESDGKRQSLEVPAILVEHELYISHEFFESSTNSVCELSHDKRLLTLSYTQNTIFNKKTFELAEGSDAVVYLTQNGSGKGSLNAPFGDINDAINSFGGNGGTIVVIGSYEISKITASNWTGMVTVTGYDSSSVITTVNNRGLQFSGPVTFKDIELDLGNYSHLDVHGSQLVMDPGEGVVLALEKNSLLHMPFSGTTVKDSAYLELDSGEVTTINLAGSYATSYMSGTENDVDFVMNGGAVTSLLINASSFLETHTGITIGGNLNVIINGGTVSKINYAQETAPIILGALNFIFNNGVSVPASFKYPSHAIQGTYIIRSGVGGKILPTYDAGVFEVIPEPDMAAVIDGKIIHDDFIELTPGSYDITWTNVSNKLLTFEVGSRSAYIDETQKALSAPVTVKDGKFLFPLRDICAILGYGYITSPDGTVLVSAENSPYILREGSLLMMQDSLVSQLDYAPSVSGKTLLISSDTLEEMFECNLHIEQNKIYIAAKTVDISYIEESLPVVYVDTTKTSGDGTVEAPFPDMESALAALSKTGGTVKIIGTLKVNSYFAQTFDKMITVTGYDSSSVINVGQSNYAGFNGPVTLKDIEVDLETSSHINTIRSPLVIDVGDNVNFNSASSTNSRFHFPSVNTYTVDNPYLEWNSGTLSNLYLGGGYHATTECGATGHSLFVMNGGSITNACLYADRFNSSHIGVSIIGNLSIVQNGGTITKFVTSSDSLAPDIHGALNFVFNGGIQPPASFSYPTTATSGVFIVKSKGNGKVMPTGTAGVFEMIPDEGMAAFIGNVRQDSKYITLSPGETNISFEPINTLYVSADAADGGDGSYDKPFASVNDAITVLDKLGGGTIKIIGEVFINTDGISWENMITISATDETSVIRVKDGGGTLFNGPVTIRDIKVSLGKHSHMNTNGHPLIVDPGENINLVSSESAMVHFPTYGNSTINNAYLEWNSGTISVLYAGGGYCTDTTKGIKGDSTLVFNGGKAKIMLSADKFKDYHTGITIGGNMNIIVSGGTVSSISYNEQTQPIVGGALNFVFNGGINPPTTFSYPDCAKFGTYIVKSLVGGTVTPTSAPGIFMLKANQGKTALVNGKTYKNGPVILNPGTTVVTWINGNATNTQKAAQSVSMSVTAGSSKLSLNGKEYTMSAAAALSNGEILVPAADIFTTLGAHVVEFGELGAVSALIGEKQIVISGDSAKINGQSHTLKTPCAVIGSKLCVSIKDLSDMLEIPCYGSSDGKAAVMSDAAASFVGAQIRRDGKQALRFIFSMPKEIYQILGEGEFGFVTMQKKHLKDEILTKDHTTISDGYVRKAVSVPAQKIFDSDESSVYFTLCITDLPTSRYAEEFVVSAYVELCDGQSYMTKQTDNISILSVAEAWYNDDSASYEEKQFAHSILKIADPVNY